MNNISRYMMIALLMLASLGSFASPEPQTQNAKDTILMDTANHTVVFQDKKDVIINIADNVGLPLDSAHANAQGFENAILAAIALVPGKGAPVSAWIKFILACLFVLLIAYAIIQRMRGVNVFGHTPVPILLLLFSLSFLLQSCSLGKYLQSHAKVTTYNLDASTGSGTICLTVDSLNGAFKKKIAAIPKQ